MIRLMIPDMPTADDILPFLRRIDDARWYANGGPLVRELEEAISYLVGAQARAVTNGTAALTLALRALRLPPRSNVLIPGLTFIATAQAVLAAGHEPVLADVAPDTWQLTPEEAADALNDGSLDIAAVVPVAAYGLAVPVGEWHAIARRVPVVIDAAGAIYDQLIGPCTVAFSMHATKALGCGEGGIVASNNASIIRHIEEMRAFGHGGENAKLDEYRAAVALAGLRRKKRDWRGPLMDAYLAHMPAGCRVQAGGQTHRTMLPVMLPMKAQARDVIQRLRVAGVEARRWYDAPPMLSQEFAGAETTGPLPTAHAVWNRVVGLPWHHGMTPDDAETVCTALWRILQGLPE